MCVIITSGDLLRWLRLQSIPIPNHYSPHRNCPRPSGNVYLSHYKRMGYFQNTTFTVASEVATNDPEPPGRARWSNLSHCFRFCVTLVSDSYYIIIVLVVSDFVQSQMVYITIMVIMSSNEMHINYVVPWNDSQLGEVMIFIPSFWVDAWASTGMHCTTAGNECKAILSLLPMGQLQAVMYIGTPGDLKTEVQLKDAGCTVASWTRAGEIEFPVLN